MRTQRAVVVGAGMAGLAAAIDLARRGIDVLVVESAPHAGGKMRETVNGDERIDAGPTVFTMRWIFEELFADAGSSLDDYLTLKSAEILARHAWNQRDCLDLFADRQRSADAIAAFAGPAEARGYLAFCQRAEAIYDALEHPFIRSSRPSMPALVVRFGIDGLGNLLKISPFSSMWRALTGHFKDPRLRQLFGRYATYCGSSPYLAPATLMLVAHVEQRGVWLVEGGMQRVASALTGLATRRGVCFRFGAAVSEIKVAGGRASGIVLASGEHIDADIVVMNADVSAIAGGRFGAATRASVPLMSPRARSMSALTWTMRANTSGFALLRHNVFFSDNYASEFDDVFQRTRLPGTPTVYVCAQDRNDDGTRTNAGAERLLCLVNAPASGDVHTFDAEEIAICESATFDRLAKCGLTLTRDASWTTITTPNDFERLFPGTGGALYGRASHGWMASFQRPGSSSRIPGLYLAGGSVHPGPGIAMAAMSGRLAATAVLADLASGSRSRLAATPGGMSMR